MVGGWLLLLVGWLFGCLLCLCIRWLNSRLILNSSYIGIVSMVWEKMFGGVRIMLIMK